MLTIRDHSGSELLTLEIGKGSKRVFSLMKDDYVSLKFSLAEPVRFGIGAYAVVDGFGRFELTSLCQPKQNAKTGGWDYELQLDAHYVKWKNKIFKCSPEDAGGEASWSLTADLAAHMGVFLRNLQALGYDFDGTPYSFSIDSSVADSAKAVSYESASLLDSLYKMADAFECEVWVEDSVINFGRCEFGDAVEFRQDANVEAMEPESNRADYATRIYAFGSEKNLPKSYRPSAPSLTVNGVAQKRLMLPADTPCIDSSPGLATVEAVEAVVVFDDVYPRTRTAIGDVSAVAYDEKDDDGNPTGETWEAYRFKALGFAFSEDYILDGEELQATFQTGKLAGMTFNVKFNPLEVGPSHADYQLWEVIRNEDYGRPLPDGALLPANGDEIVLTGWDASKIASLGLVEAAEQELKQRAQAKMEELKVDPSNYRCKMISAAMFDAGGIWHPYSLGSRVALINKGCFESGERESRIIGYEYDLAQPFNSPVYVVGEKAASSRISEIETKIDTLALAGQAFAGTGSGSGVYIIRTNDSTAPSDANVYSALRAKRDFLSRAVADTALGKITFAQGLESMSKAVFDSDAQFGANFISGMAGGQGGKIDRHGNGELESLTLRSWLEVPELRFNRAEVLLGDQWRAPGGGIIESVSIDCDGNGDPLRTGTITLKLEEGEIGAVAAGDICKGYYHDFRAPANNAAADVDDSRGNTQFSGFCTVFFRVTEVLSEGGTNKTFKYMLRPESERWPRSFHPFEAMHFVAYGSFTSADRQKSAYQTRTYTRFLKGVDDWEFDAYNVAMQFGDLSNLSVFGLDMTGYSAYLQNIYMSGTIHQVEIEAETELEVSTSTGGYFVASGESLTLECAVKKAWQDLTDSALSWKIERDSGDAAADSAWNAAHPMHLPRITLQQADIGATTLNASALFAITAEGDGWTASKTVALYTLRLPSTLSMRFVSEYGEYDTFIGFGDTVRFQAVVEDGLRNDYTSEYDQWSIERHNGDTPDDIASDGVWNATRAAISQTGGFAIEWSAQHDDLQAERATFVVTAQKGAAAATMITGTLSI